MENSKKQQTFYQEDEYPFSSDRYLYQKYTNCQEKNDFIGLKPLIILFNEVIFKVFMEITRFFLESNIFVFL